MTPLDGLAMHFRQGAVAHMAIDLQHYYHKELAAREDLHGGPDLALGVDDFADALRPSLRTTWVYHAFVRDHSDIRELRPFTGEERRQKLAAFREEAYRLCGRPKNLEDRILAKAEFDTFCNEGLADELKEQGVRSLILTGMYADRCVQGTAISAAMAHFHVFIVSDLVAWTRHTDIEGWNADMDFYNVHRVKAKDVLAAKAGCVPG